jgi:hypothetical protein
MPRAVIPVTWRLDPALFAKVQAAARRRGLSVQAYASDALRRAVEDEPDVDVSAIPVADARWLDADLSRLDEFEPYDWGTGGLPELEPVRFPNDSGFASGRKQ